MPTREARVTRQAFRSAVREAMAVESVTGFKCGACVASGGGCYLQRYVRDLVDASTVELLGVESSAGGVEPREHGEHSAVV
ncbi:hypothetical protein GCM10027568_10480 [Humibacter soli]